MKTTNLSVRLGGALLVAALLLGMTGIFPAAAQSPCGPNYVVQSGDYLTGIASICGVAYADLLAANPQIENPDLIYPGQVINIPSGSIIPITGDAEIIQVYPLSGAPGTQALVNGAGFPANATIDLSVYRQGQYLEPYPIALTATSQGTFSTYIVIPESLDPGNVVLVTATARSDADETDTVAFEVRSGASTPVYPPVYPYPPVSSGELYTVQPGDTLVKIAGKLDTTVSALRRANPQLETPFTLVPGMRLYVPGETGYYNNNFVYFVQRGDSISEIAARYNLNTRTLLAYNPQILTPSQIRPGDPIVIPTGRQAAGGSIIPITGASGIYSVLPGDNLSTIASRFGVSLNALIAANPQIANPDLIYPGQQISIP